MSKSKSIETFLSNCYSVNPTSTQSVLFICSCFYFYQLLVSTLWKSFHGGIMGSIELFPRNILCCANGCSKTVHLPHHTPHNVFENYYFSLTNKKCGKPLNPFSNSIYDNNMTTLLVDHQQRQYSVIMGIIFLPNTAKIITIVRSIVKANNFINGKSRWKLLPQQRIQPFL